MEAIQRRRSLLRAFDARAERLAKEHRDIRESHSIEEAEERHERKYRRTASRAL